MKSFDRLRPKFSPYGFTCELWEPVRMPRPDTHNEIEINFLQSGALTYLLGGHRTTIDSGRVAVFWAGIPHQIVDVCGEDSYFVVTVPLSEFLAAGLPVPVVNRILHGDLIVDPVVDSCDEPKFRLWEREFRDGDAEGQRAARLEIHARLIRLARPLAGKSEARQPEPQLSRADQLACYIARNYHEPLTADGIAKAVGLHPNYAMNLFRRAFGATITSFIVQHRITHAQRLLLTTNDAVLDVALSAGFQSLSRFNEAFKAACGCSPREYRKAHRA